MKALSKWSDPLLSVLRIAAGLTFLEHGTAKLLHFPHVAMLDHVQLASLIGAAGIIELAGGTLVTLGLFTRIAAFLCSGEMAVGYFLVHVRSGGFFPLLNGGDAAILFCFVFLYLAAAGGGSISLDRARGA